MGHMRKKKIKEQKKDSLDEWTVEKGRKFDNMEEAAEYLTDLIQEPDFRLFIGNKIYFLDENGNLVEEK